jgi:histidinol phosphatase-like PHP family hydrolase
MDLNGLAAAALQDLAAVQASKPREWAYKRAAAAIRGLPVQVAALVQTDGSLPRIPHIGPASSRIVLEVLASGHSPTVERAIEGSGRRREIDQKRSWRRNFLSRAAALAVLQQPAGRRLVSRYKADFQMHSTWSDGRQTLEDIVAACLARGYTHTAVTDHSGGLPIARGMPPERVMAQSKEVARLNLEHQQRFRLLHGIEANIRIDGSIDVEAEDRRRLDLVVAAPHAGLRMPEAQTARMVAAVREPGVHILGHPRARKYGARPGLTAEWEDVFDAAAEHGVAIEIDGDPSRQDLDFELAALAVKAGCLIALDSDAHSVDELGYVELAAAHATLARVRADSVINCWPLEKLVDWLDNKR